MRIHVVDTTFTACNYVRDFKSDESETLQGSGNESSLFFSLMMTITSYKTNQSINSSG